METEFTYKTVKWIVQAGKYFVCELWTEGLFMKLDFKNIKIMTTMVISVHSNFMQQQFDLLKNKPEEI